jgi:hypothetical protein
VYIPHALGLECVVEPWLPVPRWISASSRRRDCGEVGFSGTAGRDRRIGGPKVEVRREMSSSSRSLLT